MPKLQLLIGRAIVCRPHVAPQCRPCDSDLHQLEQLCARSVFKDVGTEIDLGAFR
jgi:hypothetical protein